MERLPRLAHLPPPLLSSTSSRFPKALPSPHLHRRRFLLGSSLHRCKKIEEQDLYGLPKEYYDDDRNGKPGRGKRPRNCVGGSRRKLKKRKGSRMSTVKLVCDCRIIH